MWVIYSAHPRATRAYEVICEKAHLLIDDDMPECLLDAVGDQPVALTVVPASLTQRSLVRWHVPHVRPLGDEELGCRGEDAHEEFVPHASSQASGARLTAKPGLLAALFP